MFRGLITRCKVREISQNGIGSIFTVEKSASRGTSVSRWLQPVCSHLLTLVPRSLIFLPWRWKRYFPPKRRFTQDLHGATSQKTAFFIVTAVKTSDLLLKMFCNCNQNIRDCLCVMFRPYRRHSSSKFHPFAQSETSVSNNFHLYSMSFKLRRKWKSSAPTPPTEHEGSVIASHKWDSIYCDRCIVIGLHKCDLIYCNWFWLSSSCCLHRDGSRCACFPFLYDTYHPRERVAELTA
jgi:hypothetical protein